MLDKRYGQWLALTTLVKLAIPGCLSVDLILETGSFLVANSSAHHTLTMDFSIARCPICSSIGNDLFELHVDITNRRFLLALWEFQFVDVLRCTRRRA